MRLILPAVIFLSFLAASVCGAQNRQSREDALSAVARIQTSAPPSTLYDEFGNIMDTMGKAEELFERGDKPEAENLYRLVILKSSLYEEKVRRLQQAHEEPSQSKTSNVRDPSCPPPANALQEGGTEADATTAGGIDETDDEPSQPHLIIGRRTTYTVNKGDTLRLIGARFGVSWRVIARDNGLDPGTGVKPGQKLRINTTRIIPKTMAEGIVINIPDRTLYLFKGRKLEKALPVGLGMIRSSDAAIWQTPTGKFRIISKVKNPTWFVPPSIQSEMRRKGRKVTAVVPPGDRNPLGKYALKTSLAGIMIHGTIFPQSIFGFSSHGCVRVMPDNMEEIYKEVKVNTGGEIIYQPVKVARSDDGRIFLEVHGDVYGKYADLESVARELIVKMKAQGEVDWEKVRRLVKKRSGIAEDISARDSARLSRTAESTATPISRCGIQGNPREAFRAIPARNPCL